MTTIHETIIINADPAAVWEIAGQPGRIAEWLPAVASSTAEGDRRSCTLQDGGSLEERILERSDEERFYEYEIVDGPLPLSAYRSRFSVEGHEGHAHVEWKAEFAPEAPEQEQELKQMFSGLYREGLEALRARVEGSA